MVKKIIGWGVLRGFGLFLSAFLAVFGDFLWAQEKTTEVMVRSAPSAIRETNTDYTEYIRKHKMLMPEKFRKMRATAFDFALPLSELPIEKIPDWSNESAIENSFFYLRDVQFLNDSQHNLWRRSSWLFPDDGCFARAELAKENLEKAKQGLVSKVFLYGNLMAQTENSVGGYVQWWYHVALAVRQGPNVFVFDPALKPGRPIELMEWVKLQTDETEAVTISVCDPDTYSPSDNCESAEPVGEQAVRDQIRFLDDEWDRQSELGRNPRTVLGDSPPWKK